MAHGLHAHFILEHNTEHFTSFCRLLRDGMPVQGAIPKAYGRHIDSLADLQMKWSKWIFSQDLPAEVQIKT